MRSAVVLAGGAGRRFQVEGTAWEDKALAKLLGKSLIRRVVESLIEVVDEVVIVVNTKERAERHEAELRGCPYTKVCVDELPSGGPLVGLMTGLKRLRSEYSFITTCDVPFLRPNLVEGLFDLAIGFNAVVPTWPNGKIEPLMAVCKTKAALERALHLLWLKRMRPDDLIRGGGRTLFASTVELREFDPELLSFFNVNYRRDLVERPKVNEPAGPVRRSFSLIDFDENVEADLVRQARKALEADLIRAADEAVKRMKLGFWSSVLSELLAELYAESSDHELSGRFLERAFEGYEAELKAYEGLNLAFLAAHALADKHRCLTKLKRFDEASKALEEASKLYVKMDLDSSDIRRRIA